MQAGILYPMDEKKFKKEVENNNRVSVGIDVKSLYDDINILEIQTNYNYQEAIRAIKQDLMMILGIVVPADPKQPQSSEDDKNV